MGETSIEWTDRTWSPIRARVKENAHEIAMLHGWTELAEIVERMKGHVGPHCEVISTGCNHCYSCTNNHRCLPSNGTGLPFDKRSRELVDIFIDEKMLAEPLHWKKDRKIFVENQSDLFGEWVPFEFIDRVFAVMALTPQHTYQILTKRPERMREYFKDVGYRQEMIGIEAEYISGTSRYIEGSDETTGCGDDIFPRWTLPLPNVWLGVSVENQQYADERIPLLLQTPAAIRFVSYEPALGPVNFTEWLRDGIPTAEQLNHSNPRAMHYVRHGAPRIDWIIAGGESGAGARPMHPAWARTVRDQCEESGAAFFFKQWGGWFPRDQWEGNPELILPDDEDCTESARLKLIGPLALHRVGKKAAGALLDGEMCREFPSRRGL